MTQQPSLGAEVVSGVRAAPLLDRMLRLLEARWDGTLLVRDPAGALVAAIRFQAGVAVAGRGHGESPALMQRLLPLCARMEWRLEQADLADLVGDGPDVATGPVDPVWLAAEVARAGMCDDQVDEAIETLAQDAFKLCPRTDSRRYGPSPQERQAFAALGQAPLRFDELLERALIPARALRRLVYALLLTRGLTVVPAWRRIASGAIEHGEPLPTARPASRQDEPTKVVSLHALARQHAFETSPSRPANSTLLEYRDSSVPRARVERPTGSGPPPAVPYHVRHPDNGTLNVPGALRASQSPHDPTRSSRPAPTDGAADVDADMLVRAAELFLQRGDYQRAVLAAQKAMKLVPPRPERRAFYAWLLYQRSGAGAEVPAHVREHLEQALHDDPDCAIAHRYLGVMLARIGEVERARSHFRRALQLDSGDADAERELVLLEREQSKS